MRISLASSLLLLLKVLLLDELSILPDEMTVIWLGDSPSRRPHTSAVMSHDFAFTNKVCTDIIHAKNHKLIMCSGNYDGFGKVGRAAWRARARHRRPEDEVCTNKILGASCTTTQNALTWPRVASRC